MAKADASVGIQLKGNLGLGKGSDM